MKISEMLVYSEIDAAQYYIGRQIPPDAEFDGNRVFTGPIDTSNTDDFGIFGFDNSQEGFTYTLGQYVTPVAMVMTYPESGYQYIQFTFEDPISSNYLECGTSIDVATEPIAACSTSIAANKFSPVLSIGREMIVGNFAILIDPCEVVAEAYFESAWWEHFTYDVSAANQRYCQMPTAMIEPTQCGWSVSAVRIYEDSDLTVTHDGSVVQYDSSGNQLLVQTSDMGLAYVTRTYYIAAAADDSNATEIEPIVLTIDFISECYNTILDTVSVP